MAEPPSSTDHVDDHQNRDDLLDWLHEQRWFGAKSQSLVGAEVVEEGRLTDALTLTLLQVHFATGGHELYQLVLDRGTGEHGVDLISDASRAGPLLTAIDQAGEVGGRHGQFSFRHVGEPDPEAVAGQVRAMGVEQSNSSLVFGDRIVLKLFRKLEPGINPDLEMLRFLMAHEYPNIAPLHGWYEYEGEALAATLGIAQRFVPGATDGWTLALEQIPHEPDRFLEQLAVLGVITAQLHSVLAGDAGDPAFSPQEPSSEFLNLLRATLDEQLERVFGQLPDDPAVGPIAGLEQEIRERITLPSQGAIGGRSIRIHGDYHLGQTLHTDAGWTLIDFEGEPVRPLNARRQKRSPLRDVASMLRSFSYATWAVKLQRGLEPPAGFEERARQAFLDAYLGAVDPTLLPHGESQTHGLLATFELEKALYELQYELDNRPDWVAIPVAGILRLAEAA